MHRRTASERGAYCGRRSTGTRARNGSRRSPPLRVSWRRWRRDTGPGPDDAGRAANPPGTTGTLPERPLSEAQLRILTEVRQHGPRTYGGHSRAAITRLARLGLVRMAITAGAGPEQFTFSGIAPVTDA